MIRVLLIDDHPIVRAGIRNILNKAPDIRVVGEAEDGDDGLLQAAALSPDIVILDLEMPRMHGSEVARRIIASKQRTKILILSAYNDPQFVAVLLEMGVAGYLTKGDAADAVVEAVRAIARSNAVWLGPSVARRALRSV